jgi:Asp-tRNA(Asn)/Glu-tRNA(Gln) amidotransferase A subunit family amidase
VLDVLAGRDGGDPRQPADLVPEQYAAALGGDVAGLRVGVVAEGFGWAELSEPGVDDTVRAAAGRLRELGIEVVDVDLPWHRHALHVWNVIATDGATVQMIEGNGYGWNYEGRYDPDLIAHYGRPAARGGRPVVADGDGGGAGRPLVAGARAHAALRDGAEPGDRGAPAVRRPRWPTSTCW